MYPEREKLFEAMRPGPGKTKLDVLVDPLPLFPEYEIV